MAQMIKLPEFEEMDARTILSAIRFAIKTEEALVQEGKKLGLKLDRLERVESEISRAIRDQGEDC